ncbi:radical SAM family heme chaperone HemW [Tindallia californiensis]|uniref:Heme chaperone HemW n=1 Tax=Tindallia californiensis TaxID=159292 RepID=A0A1H3ITV2_9FIRM|nr:radical SAM family heme chaperone HemW [Tindallia californiensis]SDY31142.1 oxygen-independent coproporphyrinogen-3 oxidase [Tindallia californiensis]
MKQEQAISLYIHVPFCASKCHYCDFVSEVGNESQVNEYVQLLSKEVQRYQKVISDKKIKTIFFGGGTPSLIPGKKMKEIMKRITGDFSVLPEAEISLEANPGQLDREKLFNYRESGINRISFGLQAIQEPLLKKLGRRHDVEIFARQVTNAREEGFFNLNVDLIFGIPGQTITDWSHSLSYIADLGIPHTSCYGLTYEEGTTLHTMKETQKIRPVEEEVEWQMFHVAMNEMKKRGYHHYEISNYCQEGSQCKHNITYWKNEEYLGIGIAAHGYLDGVRYGNTETFYDYERIINADGLPVVVQQKISKEEAMKETMFLGLRMMEGVSNSCFYQRHGVSLFDIFEKEIKELTYKKLIAVEKDNIKLTNLGIDLANQVFLYFV